jgi:hypothetical protein
MKRRPRWLQTKRLCDDEDAIAPVADLAKLLGFAPVKLGKLNEGGALEAKFNRIANSRVSTDTSRIPYRCGVRLLAPIGNFAKKRQNPDLSGR